MYKGMSILLVARIIMVFLSFGLIAISFFALWVLHDTILSFVLLVFGWGFFYLAVESTVDYPEEVVQP
jgi:hypothetical protein